ncbi:hypothetical protein Tsubulata_028051 [Turnera subulata]|uniref:CHY-type domain-containing protein n=1 Tax=Turnera subulata TaxID=218843 RepID=A0A9Q0FJX5_9ROSI|nr:hypothetical protein Tsubulata_028051 [Turnera subulata]
MEKEEETVAAAAPAPPPPPPPPSRLDAGKLEHGCEHYRRRCKIRAPCCNQVFPCRHCHNEATSSLSNAKDRHEIVRHEVTQVICSLCNTEQQVSQVCNTCGVKMGEYFCDVCKFYDDDASKDQFHCDGCGICRLVIKVSLPKLPGPGVKVGGRENFFHCEKCVCVPGSCYTVSLRDNHSCIENSMKNYCPVCYEYLFDSVKHAIVMNLIGYIKFSSLRYRCPICSKTVLDMSDFWQLLDREVRQHCGSRSVGVNFVIKVIEAVQMPQEYQYEVRILCNDCNDTSKVAFHIVGHKCSHCGSYNTRRISAPDDQ